MQKKTKITDTKFWSVLTLAGNAIGLNLTFLICCLPIVTIGPALCGLYSGVRYMIKQDGWFRGFRAGFRTHWIRSSIVGIFYVAFMYFYVLRDLNDVIATYQTQGVGLEAIITFGLIGLFVTMLCSSLWPLNIYIPGNAADWLRNAVNLVFKAPGPVFVAACLFLAPIVLILYFFTLAWYLLIVIIGGWFVFFAFIATMFYKDHLIDLLNEYRAEHPEEDEDYE